jgi:pimeloyl-ACP methyl ester carboxylesterase
VSRHSSTDYAARGRIAFERAGDPDGAPLLVCHGLADSRLCVRMLARAASERGALLIGPDRPGIGLSHPRPLDRVVDWVDDAAQVLDALGLTQVALLGISGGGPFAAACAARLGPDRVRALILASALGLPWWGTRGMAGGERFALTVATRVPGFGGAFLDALAHLPEAAFMRISTVEMPAVDRRTLANDPARAAFIDGYREAFRHGSAGVAQDLRLITHDWGFDLGEIGIPTRVHHGDADSTVPLDHARRFAAAIAGAGLTIHPGEGHFSLLAARAGEVIASA